MIEAVCWDVGGVFSARPVDAVARVAAAHDVDADELFAAVFGPYHLDGDHAWHRLERGEVALMDAWGEIEVALADLGLAMSLADLFAGFGDADVDRRIVTDTLLDLHGQGVVMAIITNNVREFSESSTGGWRSIVPMEAMTIVIDSSAVGMRKPDHAIYEHTLGALGVAPGAAVFLDDMEANVDAARALGMHGVVVGADPVAAMAELRTVIAAAGGIGAGPDRG